MPTVDPPEVFARASRFHHWLWRVGAHRHRWAPICVTVAPDRGGHSVHDHFRHCRCGARQLIYRDAWETVCAFAPCPRSFASLARTNQTTIASSTAGIRVY